MASENPAAPARLPPRASATALPAPKMNPNGKRKSRRSGRLPVGGQRHSAAGAKGEPQWASENPAAPARLPPGASATALPVPKMSPQWQAKITQLRPGSRRGPTPQRCQRKDEPQLARPNPAAPAGSRRAKATAFPPTDLTASPRCQAQGRQPDAPRVPQSAERCCVVQAPKDALRPRRARTPRWRDSPAPTPRRRARNIHRSVQVIATTYPSPANQPKLRRC
jgi:hypothetical protein